MTNSPPGHPELEQLLDRHGAVGLLRAGECPKPGAELRHRPRPVDDPRQPGQQRARSGCSIPTGCCSALAPGRCGRAGGLQPAPGRPAAGWPGRPASRGRACAPRWSTWATSAPPMAAWVALAGHPGPAGRLHPGAWRSDRAGRRLGRSAVWRMPGHPTCRSGCRPAMARCAIQGPCGPRGRVDLTPPWSTRRGWCRPAAWPPVRPARC